MQIFEYLHVHAKCFQKFACTRITSYILHAHAKFCHSSRNDGNSLLARLNRISGLNLASVLSSWTATRQTLESGAHIAPVEKVASILSTLPTKELMVAVVKVRPSLFSCTNIYQILLAYEHLRSGALRLCRHVGSCSFPGRCTCSKSICCLSQHHVRQFRRLSRSPDETELFQRRADSFQRGSDAHDYFRAYRALLS